MTAMTTTRDSQPKLSADRQADIARRYGLILEAVDSHTRRLAISNKPLAKSKDVGERGEGHDLATSTDLRAVHVESKLLASLPEGPFNPFTADRKLLARIIANANQVQSGGWGYRRARDGYNPAYGVQRAMIADRDATATALLDIVNDSVAEDAMVQKGSLAPIAVAVETGYVEPQELTDAFQACIDRLTAANAEAAAWVPDPTATTPQTPPPTYNVPSLQVLEDAVETLRDSFRDQDDSSWGNAVKRIRELEQIPPPPADPNSGDDDGDGGGGYQPSFADSLQSLQRRADAQDRRDDDDAFGGVFGGLGTSTERHLEGWIAPDAETKALATRIRRALDRARWPEPTTSVRPYALPPGKLRTRAAMQATARRAIGDPTPPNDLFERQRRRIEEPNDLSVGMCIDVSSSMDHLARVTAQWSYAFSQAAYGAGARFAATTWGTKTEGLCAPGATLTQVPELGCNEGTSDLVLAMRAVIGGLDMTRPGRARVLIVASDGELNGNVINTVAHHATRMKRAGVRLVQIHLGRGGTPLPSFDFINASSNEELCAELERLLVRMTTEHNARGDVA